MASRESQVRTHLGGLAHFTYVYIIFLKEFLREGEISPRWANPTNQASSYLYEQPLK